jgi:hypothetical protein
MVVKVKQRCPVCHRGILGPKPGPPTGHSLRCSYCRRVSYYGRRPSLWPQSKRKPISGSPIGSVLLVVVTILVLSYLLALR